MKQIKDKIIKTLMDKRVGIRAAWIVAISGFLAAIFPILMNYFYQGVENDLRLVDVSFHQSQAGQKILDIKFRNVGRRVAFLKRMDLTILDSERLEWPSNYYQQEITWRGNVCLPSQDTLNLSQVIDPGKTDQIQLQFYSEDVDVFYSILYLLKLDFVYNEDNRLVTTRPIVLLMPRQAEIQGFYPKPTREITQAIEKNRATVERFSKPRVLIDKDFQNLQNIYRGSIQDVQKNLIATGELLTVQTSTTTTENTQKHTEQSLRWTWKDLLSTYMKILISAELPRGTKVSHSVDDLQVSKYARTSPEEGFAETYRAYAENTLDLWRKGVIFWQVNQSDTLLAMVCFMQEKFTEYGLTYIYTKRAVLKVPRDKAVEIFNLFIANYKNGKSIDETERAIETHWQEFIHQKR